MLNSREEIVWVENKESMILQFVRAEYLVII